VPAHLLTIAWLTARRPRCQQQPALPEVSLLAMLGAQLERAGLRTEQVPGRDALLIYRSAGSLPVWVFVGNGGACFSWDAGRRHHPVTDVTGAARSLAAYLGGEAH
jgi:hypothetical protein